MAGIRKNVGDKKYDRHDEIVNSKKKAKIMASKIQEIIKDKKRVPHPTIKKAWIYV